MTICGLAATIACYLNSRREQPSLDDLIKNLILHHRASVRPASSGSNGTDPPPNPSPTKSRHGTQPWNLRLILPIHHPKIGHLLICRPQRLLIYPCLVIALALAEPPMALTLLELL